MMSKVLLPILMYWYSNHGALSRYVFRLAHYGFLVDVSLVNKLNCNHEPLMLMDIDEYLRTACAFCLNSTVPAHAGMPIGIIYEAVLEI